MSAAAKNAEVLPATPEPQAPVLFSEAPAIIAMIERAAQNPAVDIDKMERLLAMREREMARTAKAAYSAALSAMQPDLPIIAERGKIELSGKNGKNPTYALWEDINEAIKPVLARHRFALSFRLGRDAERVVVTGILSHADGHSEETTIQLPVDTGPGRNAVQAVASSTSYGKRYTAAALLNLTSRGEDDDGKAAGAGEPINAADLEKLQARMSAVGVTADKFCKVMKVGRIEDLPAKDLPAAYRQLDDVEAWNAQQAKTGKAKP